MPRIINRRIKIIIVNILKIKVIAIGKTGKGWVSEGLDTYILRLKKVVGIEWIELEASTNTKKSGEEGLKEEMAKLLRQVKPGDYLVLLDEKGTQFTSLSFSHWLGKKMVSIQGDLVFIIGGAYGFHEEIRKKAKEQISLSGMTFTHQMVRIFFAEQLYRGFTILRNEPYHHS